MKKGVAVIGAGTMGCGIAQVAAAAGHTVTVIDRDAEAIARGGAMLSKSLQTLVRRAQLTQDDVDAISARVRWSSDLVETASSHLVIEAIVERLDVKRQLLADLAAIVAADAIIASNTSSLSITAMAEGVPHPQRVIGLHFFNPVPAMKLVEIVEGKATAPDLAAEMIALMGEWGKHAVRVRDMPGFIVNRVARPFYAEAFVALGEGIDAAAIDAGLAGCGGFRMGPLTLADFIGHDVNYAAASSVHAGLQGQVRFRPQAGQAELVKQGLLGRKSGRGIYNYTQSQTPSSAALDDREPSGDDNVEPEEAAAFRDWLARAWDAPSPRGEFRFRSLVVARGDGRMLANRPGVNILVDHFEDFSSTPVLVVTARDQRAAEAATNIVSAVGKAPLLLPDRAGQIALRTLAQLANGAADAVEDRVASASSIDEAMLHGANYPQGPLAWACRYGTVALRQVLSNIESATRDPIYAPSTGFDLL